MEVDPAAAGAAGGGRHGDVDRAVDWAQEAPECCGGGVAQDRTLSTSENCGHPALTMSEREGAEDVDAPVHAEQLSFADADRDRLRAKSRLFELSPRENSILRSGDLGDRSVWRVTFCVHMDAKVDRASDSPPLDSPPLRAAFSRSVRLRLRHRRRRCG